MCKLLLWIVHSKQRALNNNYWSSLEGKKLLLFPNTHITCPVIYLLSDCQFNTIYYHAIIIMQIPESCAFAMQESPDGLFFSHYKQRGRSRVGQKTFHVSNASLQTRAAL